MSQRDFTPSARVCEFAREGHTGDARLEIVSHGPGLTIAMNRHAFLPLIPASAPQDRTLTWALS